MDTELYAKGVTAEDLRIFLDFWPVVTAAFDELQQSLIEDRDKFLTDDAAPFVWCHLYELPVKEHLTLALNGIVQNCSGTLSREPVADWLKQLVTSPSQIAELPTIHTKIAQHFDKMEDPSKEQAAKLRLAMANTAGIAWSAFKALHCVLYHGCFLNDLIERVRAGDDKALFDAIRIDSTVIGCPSANNRIAKATLLKDNRFFARLKAAINGKMAKREQANFQKMRLVLNVLSDAGATRLGNAQLHHLFVEELKLYSRCSAAGGCDKALRKFADTYMKQHATT